MEPGGTICTTSTSSVRPGRATRRWATARRAQRDEHGRGGGRYFSTSRATSWSKVSSYVVLARERALTSAICRRAERRMRSTEQNSRRGWLMVRRSTASSFIFYDSGQTARHAAPGLPHGTDGG